MGPLGPTLNWPTGRQAAQRAPQQSAVKLKCERKERVTVDRRERATRAAKGIDDDIDDDNDCITTSKPTHTLIVHDVIDDDDIDHQVHNQPTQLPNSYHPLVSYYVQNAGEEGDVGDDNFNDDEDVDEDGDNDDDARWFR